MSPPPVFRLRPPFHPLRALRRPQTIPGQFRELLSAVETAAVWPAAAAGRFLDRAIGVDAAAGPVTGPPIVLVHGFGANKTNWVAVVASLRAAGLTNLHTLTYNPFREGVAAVSSRLATQVRELHDTHGADVHLIGHSTGGVVISHAVQRHDVGGLVGHAITIAAPHRGAPAANLHAFAGPLARTGPFACVRDLSHGSDLLKDLADNPTRTSVQWWAFYGNLDLIVPAWSAKIAGTGHSATNECIRESGHLSIMFSETLRRRIVEILAGDTTSTPCAPSRHGPGLRAGAPDSDHRRAGAR